MLRSFPQMPLQCDRRNERSGVEGRFSAVVAGSGQGTDTDREVTSDDGGEGYIRAGLAGGREGDPQRRVTVV